MVIVFGSINVDLVCRVARTPGPGETVRGSDYALMPGGKGANQALAARRAGALVRLFGAIRIMAPKYGHQPKVALMPSSTPVV